MRQKLYNLFHKKGRLDPSEIFLVAEIGKNFIQTEEDRSVEEYISNAKRLIDEAVRAGADAVKFQTHDVEDEQADLPVTSPHFKLMERYRWLERNTRATPHQFWKEVKEYAKQKGVIFFSTPMSRNSAVTLEKYNVPLWKVASSDVDDYLLLDYVTNTGRPVIISSGMSSLDELEQIMKYLSSRKSPVGLLYCVSQYPCPLEYFNLSTIEHFQQKYPYAMIGFSDHSIDSHDVTLASIKLGARMVEKHFSLSRDLWGPDHKASLTPSEFKELAQKIRSGSYWSIDHTPFYGLPTKELEGAQNTFRPYFRKTLVAKHGIPAGKVITHSDMCALRPKMHLDGLSPDHIHNVIGKKTKSAISRHAPIRIEHFE